MDPGQQPARRRRDRLRALLPSPPSIFRRSSLLSALSSRSRHASEDTSSSSVGLGHSQSQSSDMTSRLESLDPWFEDDDEEEEEEDLPELAPVPASSISRRMSMSLRGLLTPRTRDGIYIPPSIVTLYLVPLDSYNRVAASTTSLRGNLHESTASHSPTIVDPNQSFHSLDGTSESPRNSSRLRSRSRPLIDEDTDAEERRARRATWGAGPPHAPVSTATVETTRSESFSSYH